MAGGAKGEHMMLAKAVHLDVLHDDHAVGLLREDSAVDELDRIGPITRREEGKGRGDALRRLEESLPLGILAYLQQQLADQGFDLRGVDIHRTTPVSRQRLLFAATGRCSLEASQAVNGRGWALWYAVVPRCEPATG